MFHSSTKASPLRHLLSCFPSSIFALLEYIQSARAGCIFRPGDRALYAHLCVHLIQVLLVFCYLGLQLLQSLQRSAEIHVYALRPLLLHLLLPYVHALISRLTFGECISVDFISTRVDAENRATLKYKIYPCAAPPGRVPPVSPSANLVRVEDMER